MRKWRGKKPSLSYWQTAYDVTWMAHGTLHTAFCVKHLIEIMVSSSFSSFIIIFFLSSTAVVPSGLCSWTDEKERIRAAFCPFERERLCVICTHSISHSPHNDHKVFKVLISRYSYYCYSWPGSVHLLCHRRVCMRLSPSDITIYYYILYSDDVWTRYVSRTSLIRNSV